MVVGYPGGRRQKADSAGWLVIDAGDKPRLMGWGNWNPQPLSVCIPRQWMPKVHVPHTLVGLTADCFH